MGDEQLIDGGIVVGNVYNKYESRNPIARRLLRGFMVSLDACLSRVERKAVHEVGCGEGYLAQHLRSLGFAVTASDFSAQIVARAREDHASAGIDFRVRSVYELDPEQDAADTVVCCEVLEHLEEPSRALARLASITRQTCVLSVPNEPLWSLLNLARLKYWSAWGNTPGHINRWSRSAFCRLVSEHFSILELRRPLPWTMLRCEPRR
jgi:2-polyprenyl-3-methyl-5-hydroxy-6-metoxy-1,4-benzoquinol methylase